MKSIYAIADERQRIKVGIAANPQHRLSSLQTGHSDRLIMLFNTAPRDDAPEREAQVHEVLDEWRRAGEWFDCDEDIVADAFAQAGLTILRSHRHEHRADYVPSPAAVQAWLSKMAKSPYFATEEDCARLLGVSANTVVDMKQRGADLRTALACRALFHRLEPWG